MGQDELQKDLINRLRTVKGHIGGIEKMIEEQKSCDQVLMQIAAVRAAMDKIAMSVVENYAEECIMGAIEEPGNIREKVQEIVKTLSKFTK